MGEMGPFAAALGVRDDALNIALQRYAYGGWEYASVLITTQDSDIESIEDIEGSTVAFADTLSASGSLYPLYMIQDAGIEIGGLPEDSSGAAFEATFSSHAAAFEQLQAGQADAAGVGFFQAVVDGDEQRGEYKEGIQEIAIEEGIPRAPICTTPQFSDAQRQAVVDAFLNAPDEMYYGADGEEGTEDDIWFSDVREADAGTYEPVVEVARELGIESDLLDQGVGTDSA
jgi:phosphonate transport system substrate-binding protein